VIFRGKEMYKKLTNIKSTVLLLFCFSVVNKIRLKWFSYCCRKQWTVSAKGHRRAAKFWKILKAAPFGSFNSQDVDQSATSGKDFIKLHLGQTLLRKIDASHINENNF
jgi:hypothetical protein